MKKMIAFVAPILPGQTENWNSFANELTTTYAKEFTQSRKNLNVHERTYLQNTPNGDFIIVTLEGNDPESALKTFANTNDSFTKWFLNNVKELHGIDMKDMKQLPTLVLDTETMKVPTTANY